MEPHNSIPNKCQEWGMAPLGPQQPISQSRSPADINPGSFSSYSRRPRGSTASHTKSSASVSSCILWEDGLASSLAHMVTGTRWGRLSGRASKGRQNSTRGWGRERACRGRRVCIYRLVWRGRSCKRSVHTIQNNLDEEKEEASWKLGSFLFI